MNNHEWSRQLGFLISGGTGRIPTYFRNGNIYQLDIADMRENYITIFFVLRKKTAYNVSEYDIGRMPAPTDQNDELIRI